jgi:hypothetical protein
MQTFQEEHPTATRNIKSGSFPAAKQKGPAEFRQAIESLTPPLSCRRCQVISASTASCTLMRKTTPSLRHHPHNHPLTTSPWTWRMSALLRSQCLITMMPPTCKNQRQPPVLGSIKRLERMLCLATQMETLQLMLTTMNILGPPSSVGRRAVDIQNTTLCTVVRPFSVCISNMVCSMESPMKWEQKGEDSNSSCEKCTPVPSHWWKLPALTIATLRYSPETHPLILQSNKLWSDWTTQAHWLKLPDSKHLAYGSQYTPSSSRRCRSYLDA